MSNESIESFDTSGLSKGEFEFGRRTALKAATAISAGGLLSSAMSAGIANAASKTGVIKIGYVSPQTGALAGFAGPDNYVVSLIRNTAAFKKGIKIGGTTYPIEIIYKDTQSAENVAVQVTQELIAEGATLIMTEGAPETTIPVATTCEQAKVPCLSTVVPWEAYWGGFSGTSITAEGGAGGTGPKYNACYFFGMAQFAQCFVPMIEKIQAKTGCNSTFAEMFPNDADGNAFAGGFAPTVNAIYPNKFQFVTSQNGYTDLSGDWSAMAQAFKTQGPNGGPCDLFICCPLPPDFQSFWTTASQQGWLPKIATVAKVMLFPSDATALGALSKNIATDAWFTPYAPYKSSLDGLTAAKFATNYQTPTRQWVQSMGSTYTLFEVAYNALSRVKSLNPLEIAEALQTTDMKMTMCGPLNMNSTGKDGTIASPAKGIGIIPPVGVQWKPGSTKLIGGRKYDWSQYVVDNTLNKSVPLNGTLEPTSSI